jgi:uncharacterized protein (DUF1919 family)
MDVFSTISDNGSTLVALNDEIFNWRSFLEVNNTSLEEHNIYKTDPNTNNALIPSNTQEVEKTIQELEETTPNDTNAVTWDKFATIPNINHFVFSLREQTEDFLFCYYLAVYSAYKVNNPEKVFFYYHYTITGKWWQQLLIDIPCLVLEKISIPTHIGKKPILKTAHLADKVRMDILWERGGVYMDIDTISVKPYHNLLFHEVVLGTQLSLRSTKTVDDNTGHVSYSSAPHIGGICNAVMFARPKTPFFKLWMDAYEDAFDPTKWEEASILLPYALALKNPSLLTLVDHTLFFSPGYYETNKIFEDECSVVPKPLMTLHLTESFGMKYMKSVTGWDWESKNPNTMYARIMRIFSPVYHNEACIVSNNAYGRTYYAENAKELNTPFVDVCVYTPCYIKLLENFQNIIRSTMVECERSKYIDSFTYPIGLLGDDIEIHFINDRVFRLALDKWDRRKRTLSRPSLLVMCDDVAFTTDIGRRFCNLSNHLKKVLLLSNANVGFTTDDPANETQIIHTNYKTMPSQLALEKEYNTSIGL